MNKKKISKKFKGIAVAPGIALGDVSLYAGKKLNIQEFTVPIKDLNKEVKRFRSTVSSIITDLKQTLTLAEKQYSSDITSIFEAQIILLQDEIFLKEIDDGIIQQRRNAEFVVYNIFKERQDYFSKQESEYFRDRALDLQALKRQIITELQGPVKTPILTKVSIVVAPDLSPQETLNFDRRKTLAFAIDHGGKTSHTAILARSLEIPCVVGLHNFSTIAREGDILIVDGTEGVVYLNPSQEIISRYKERQLRYEKLETDLLQNALLPVETKQGIEIELLANLELQDETQAVKHVGAKGVGLLRTEGLFIEQGKIPPEEAQVKLYTKISKAVYPLPITIRTIDIGGDKTISQLAFPPESNPFLGWRAIRFCLDSPIIFKEQLRAILRASGKVKSIKIMFPFITCVEEIRKSKVIVEECKAELKSESLAFNPDIEIGIMIETPAAALMGEVFSSEVDFFSIGTNDLTQYIMAVDRGNDKIADLYSHYFPGVLQMIQKVLRDGQKANIPVSICGEMAGDPLATVLLLGLGIRIFSAAPVMLPTIAGIIRETSLKNAERLANKVLGMDSAITVESYLKRYMQKNYSHIMH